MTKPPHSRARNREGGFTLVEIAIVVATSAVIAGIIIQTISLLTSGQTATRNRLRATSLAERVINRVRQDLDYAVRVYQHGDSMLGKLGLPSDAYLSGSRMPVASMVGFFDRDSTSKVHTGNLLVSTRQVGKVIVDLSTVQAGLRQRVDCFRFVVWYLSKNEQGQLDLNRWVSKRLARHKDVTGSSNPALEPAIIADLRQRDILYAWDPSSTSTGLYKIAAVNDEYEAFTSTDRIPADPKVVDFELLIPRHIEVAPNGSKTPLPVPFYAQVQSSFPHGFEIKIDGDASGMLVLVRLAVRTLGSGQAGYAVATREVAFKQS